MSRIHLHCRILIIPVSPKKRMTNRILQRILNFYLMTYNKLIQSLWKGNNNIQIICFRKLIKFLEQLLEITCHIQKLLAKKFSLNFSLYPIFQTMKILFIFIIFLSSVVNWDTARESPICSRLESFCSWLQASQSFVFFFLIRQHLSPPKLNAFILNTVFKV